MKNKKILVTGANGFVGSYIIRQLVQSGYTHIIAGVRAGGDIKMIEGLEDKIEITELDILDVCRLEEVTSNVDVVIHTAALVSFEPRLRNKLYKVNVEGTANVVNIALEKPIEKFIHISSVAALGRLKNDLTIDENTKWAASPFNTHYAISKYMAEQEVWRGFHEGLPVAIIQPTLILGAGDWSKGSINIIASISKGLKYYPVGSTGIVDVRDVAKMAEKLLESPITGERFICNGEDISYHELFGKIAGQLNLQPPSKPLTPILAAAAWRLEAFKNLVTRKPLTVTKETLMTTSMNLRYDASKAIDILGMEFRNAEITINDCCKSYTEVLQTGKNYSIF